MSEFTKFSVWEHIKTESDFNAYIETLEEQHAAALRQARIEALEEAAKAVEEGPYPNTFDRWDAGYYEACRANAVAIRALKDKQP